MATKAFTATVEGLRSLQDRSVKLTLVTQELLPSEMGDIFAFQGKFCKILITDNNVINPDMQKATEELEVEEWEKKKSQGARLRGVLFLLWQKDKKGHETFDTYYNFKTNEIIEFYKSKIDS